MKLGTYSIGIGDRFARQGKALLRAVVMAKEKGVAVTPVWNKSHREHTIIGTAPASVRAEADAAVAALGWPGAYFVDADHVGMKTVDVFIESSDFFTLDVADFTGQGAPDDEIACFVRKHVKLVGALEVPGIDKPLAISEDVIAAAARGFLLAVKEAGRIYRHVEAAKGAGNFVTEVSMDETEEAQTPVEMLFILAAIAEEGIPARTIAPKFSGRFNKGVDYAGDVGRFAKEFEDDLAVITFAVREFGLPEGLKLSIHSGSDKFSIYGPMREAMRRHDAGLHLKTAGTTWLEELVGLAEAGGEGLVIAREIYRSAFGRIDELRAPYAAVTDIERARLPAPDTVDGWSGEEFAGALRHDPACELYDPNLRQLLHIAYKVAAEMGARYLAALAEFEGVIARNVSENIYERHLKRVFLAG